MQNLTINGRYRILQQIGVGGFGLTYLAEDLHLPTRPKCVVKHLKPQINDAETMQLANRLFQQEAEILYRLGGHPNIPSLIAHFRENGEFYLVQEYIEGQTIAQEFAAGRRYNQKEMIQLIGQTLEILSFVHKQNVIHRDIKPANLIRRYSDDSIFLIDFGAVKQVNAFPNNSQNSTFSTLTIGSHGYMPTEQMAGKPNFSSDLYALGLVAIESLTGIKPLELKQNHNTGEHIWTHKAEVSPEVMHFVGKLVRYDFRQRYISATEALNSLNVIASKAGFFPPKNSLQAAPIAPRKIVSPNNQIVSTITLTPLVNVPSALTLVPAAKNIPDNLVPPTVIVPIENHQAFQPLQYFQNPQSLQINQPPSDISNGNSPMSKAAILIGVFLLFAGGLIFAARSVIKNMQPPDVLKTDGTYNPPNTERPMPESVSKVSGNSSMLYEEALKQAEEARIMEGNATTKPEWEQIGKKYKRAYGLLSSIDENNPYYQKAQEKISDYKQKSETAFQKSLTVVETPIVTSSNPTISNYETIPDSSSIKSTATPVLTKLNVSMPPKKTYSIYLSYNFFNGREIEQKIITAKDAIFTPTVEKQTQNKRDSGVVKIDIDGGSYSSAQLELKPIYGQKLTAGNYPGAQEYLWQSPTSYAVSFDKLHCFEKGIHSFTVNNIIYNELYSNISLIDATFVINCDSRKLMGRIHYDAR